MKKIYALSLIFASCLVLSGCGKKSENVSAALIDVQGQQYEEALETLDIAQAEGEDEQLIARARGIAYIGMARYEEAEEEFFKALSLANGHVREPEIDISYYLAVAQNKAGKKEDAIETYSAILDMRPEAAETYFLRGMLRLELGLYDDAIRDFNNDVDNDGLNPDMYVQIYETLKAAGYEEQANDYLAQAQKVDAKFTDYQKGKLAYCQGDYEGARTYLEKARMAEDTDVILYLGKTYEALGDMNYAASLYKTYLEKNPEDATVLNQLGLCQMAAGEYSAARTSFEKGLSVGGGISTQSLKFNQIVACEYEGDFKEAAVLMKAYMSTYPDDTEAEREYKFLKTR